MVNDPLNQPPGAAPADGRDVITGTSASELLNGTAGHETILAGAGNDTITGGIGDYIDGGSGRNCAAYSGAGAVLVDLEHGHGYGGTAEGDALVNIQQTRGSDAADVLIASHLGSDLKGGAGNDLLIGGAGNDELRGDGGSDILFGGGGADRVFFDPTHGWDGKTDVMLDFHAQQGDWLDLSSIVHGFNGNIDNYVKLVDQADGTHVFFNADGQVATSSIELIDLKFAHGLSAQQLYLDHNIIV
jgi:Ca2+-binding RTX toxin-like protein